MKITWFGGTTLRIYIGGQILLCRGDTPLGVDVSELLSGADRAFALDGVPPSTEASPWRPREALAPIDEMAAQMTVEVVRLAPGLVAIDAPGEPPLLLASGHADLTPRWGRDAVVIVLGEPAELPDIAASVLDRLGPRLIAIAGPESAIDAVFARIGAALEGTSLVSLEPGLALEA